MAELRRSSFQMRNGGAETIKRESWQSCSIWKLPPPPHSHEEIFWEDILTNILITYNVYLWHTRWINAKKSLKTLKQSKSLISHVIWAPNLRNRSKSPKGRGIAAFKSSETHIRATPKKKVIFRCFFTKNIFLAKRSISPEACWHFPKAMILRDELRYLGIFYKCIQWSVRLLITPWDGSGTIIWNLVLCWLDSGESRMVTKKRLLQKEYFFVVVERIILGGRWSMVIKRKLLR